jgi:hypothetical protein
MSSLNESELTSNGRLSLFEGPAKHEGDPSAVFVPGSLCSPSSPQGRAPTHIFGWTPGAASGLLVSPRFPMASYQGTPSGVPNRAAEIMALAAAASGAKAQFPGHPAAWLKPCPDTTPRCPAEDVGHAQPQGRGLKSLAGTFPLPGERVSRAAGRVTLRQAQGYPERSRGVTGLEQDFRSSTQGQSPNDKSSELLPRRR